MDFGDKSTEWTRPLHERIMWTPSTPDYTHVPNKSVAHASLNDVNMSLRTETMSTSQTMHSYM